MKFYGICCTVLKKSPDDGEQILKNFPKLSLHFDELLNEDGYGVNGLILDDTKLKKMIIFNIIWKYFFSWYKRRVQNKYQIG